MCTHLAPPLARTCHVQTFKPRPTVERLQAQRLARSRRRCTDLKGGSGEQPSRNVAGLPRQYDDHAPRLDRRGSVEAMFQGVAVSSGSAATGAMRPADAMAPPCWRLALQPAPLRLGVASQRLVHRPTVRVDTVESLRAAELAATLRHGLRRRLAVLSVMQAGGPCLTCWDLRYGPVSQPA